VPSLADRLGGLAQGRLGGLLVFAPVDGAQGPLGSRNGCALHAKLFALRCHLALQSLTGIDGFVEPRFHLGDASLELLDKASNVTGTSSRTAIGIDPTDLGRNLELCTVHRQIAAFEVHHVLTLLLRFVVEEARAGHDARPRIGRGNFDGRQIDGSNHCGGSG